MGLLDFFRRKKRPASTASTLKEIWRGFQQVVGLNNQVLALMGDLEEKLAAHEGLDLEAWGAQIDVLHRRFVDLVAALQGMSGGRWWELEASRARIEAAIRQRLGEETCVYGPILMRLEMADPDLLTALGGKAGNLARIKNQLKLPVPDSVVATLTAYRVFMQQQAPGREGTLLARIMRYLADLDLSDPAAVAAASKDVQAMVLAQPLPGDLEQGLREEALRLTAAGSEPRLTVRSSGGREDLGLTFAGQYDSFLGVAPEEVSWRWRQVVASQFGTRALIYFKVHGLRLEEAAMGVLIQRLVDARAAGVIFTTDPEGCDPDRVVVSAVWGLAADLVGGVVSADEFIVSKGSGRLRQSRLGRKDSCLTVQGGLLTRLPVAPDKVAAPALQEDDLAQLANFARLLEGYYGCPQVVEWAQDRDGKLFVIQSRHLQHPAAGEACRGREEDAAAGAEVLLEGGQPGSPGVAAGPVCHLPEDGDLSQVPQDAVLVAPQTTPELAPALPRVAAVVTAVGSATGHLALVAREYGVPALVEACSAALDLPAGQVVTVDADNGRIYRGRLEELLRRRGRRVPKMPPLVLEKVRAVLDLISPLTLVDRRSPDFRPENCRTYHDITRFAHEKAIQVMFGLMDSVARGRVPALKLLKLKTDLPLNLHLVDLGDGLAGYDTPVPPEKIISRPMRALWRGISHPGITWAGPVPVDLGGFLHVLGQSAIRPPEQFWDKTYAIVGANYVNYACRLGYHFQSVDSYLGDNPADNYIQFTFKGGAADDVRRIRRIRLIATVLEHLGFLMEIHGDIIRGRFRRRSAAETEERLDLLGRLMAFVRQMDMLMSDDSVPETLAQRFLEGHYERPGQEKGAVSS